MTVVLHCCFQVTNRQLVAKASFHQASENFITYSASQCMANVFTAIAWNKKSCPSAWTSDDLNVMLVYGDSMYSDIRPQ